MKTLIGAAAVLCLACAASALAQEPQTLDGHGVYTTAAKKTAQARQVEIVEAANPFLVAPGAPAVRPLSFQEHSAHMTLGPYDRPDVADAPTPAFVRHGKDAVGLAVSFKLGG
jgi:hypothetical protein